MIEDTIDKYLTEKSLSRLLRQMQEHDSGTITAFRYASDCGDGEVYSFKDNQKRNKSLLAKIQAKRYGVTSVQGKYIENYGSKDAHEVGESVFFVVDLNETGNLEKDLKKWGAEFEQDSILFLPKGAESGVLIGTNSCKNGYPGHGSRINLKHPVFGKTGEFMTKVGGRPFVLKEEFEHIALPQGGIGRWACDIMSRKSWENIEE